MLTTERIDKWLALMQGEYLEVPGLHLTKRQAERLWGLDPHVCDALLDALVAVGFLRKTRHEAYVLADGGRPARVTADSVTVRGSHAGRPFQQDTRLG